MEYIKKFEYFDNEEDRDSNEISWLNGDIRNNLEQMVKPESIYKPSKLNNIYDRLVFNVPYLKYFIASGEIKKSRFIVLGNFWSNKFDDDNKVESWAKIHIDINTDNSYVLQFECKVIGNDNIIYQDRYSEPLMKNFNILQDVLIKKIYPKVKTWAKWTKSSFGHDPMQLDKKIKMSMIDDNDDQFEVTDVMNPQLNSINHNNINLSKINEKFDFNISRLDTIYDFLHEFSDYNLSELIINIDELRYEHEMGNDMNELYRSLEDSSKYPDVGSDDDRLKFKLLSFLI